MDDLNLSDEALVLYEELESDFSRYCYGDLPYRSLAEESLSSLRELPLAAQERLVLSLPAAPGGPHSHVATPGVAALGVEQLLGGDRFLGTEILAGMRDEHVVVALRARDALSSTDPRALSWTLRRGLAEGGNIERVEAVAAPVLDVAIDGGEVFASCRDGSLHSFTTDGHDLVVPPEEMDDPSERLALAACRLVDIDETRIVRWGWEHMAAVDRRDGSRRWEIYLGHGFDEYTGVLPVFDQVVEMGDGTFVDLAAGAWLPEEEWPAAAARIESRRHAGETGRVYGLEASCEELHVSGTPDGLVVWRRG